MNQRPDEDARRRYWARTMDEAYEFMAQALAYPVAECHEPVASLTDAAASAGIRIEFSDKPHAAGAPRLFYLREGLIPLLLAAASELNESGWVMRVEDALRSAVMQKALASSDGVFDRLLERVQWECDGEEPPPELVLRRLSALAATTAKTGTHLAGSAVDISVLALTGEEIDRDGSYIEMSERTPMASPYAHHLAHTHRQAISAVLLRHGFVAYPYEFWHYSQGDVYDAAVNRTGAPARYGPVDVTLPDGGVTPLAGAETPLFSAEEIDDLIGGARERIGRRPDAETSGRLPQT